MSQLKIISF